MNILNENEIIIPEYFNEIDEDENILRIILDFKLFNKQGNLISFDEINEGKYENIYLEGTLIEPLQNKWKDKLLEILCSRPPPDQIQLQQSSSSLTSTTSILSNKINSAQTIIPIPINDWDSLSVGDLVDGYCTRTFKWYEAKILEIKKNISPDNPNGIAMSFKIHFKKWNSKYDEWIPRDSPRLAQHGVTTDKKQIPYSSYTAWFENSIAYQKV